MPCSSQDIFAWTGAVLINISFIFGILWGTFTTWYFGASLTALYSALLFCGARGLEQRQQTQLQQESSASTEDQGSTSSSGGVVTLLISLLYGQAILAMGVAGFFVPLNVVGNGCYSSPIHTYSSDPSSYNSWVTNTSDISSSSVLAWVEASEEDPWNFVHGSTFVYLPEINTTVFRGSSPLVDTQDDEFEGLYISKAGGRPLWYGDYKYPSSMVEVTESIACFRANFMEKDVLGCYDGETVQSHPAPPFLVEIQEVRKFDDNEGVVYY